MADGLYHPARIRRPAVRAGYLRDGVDSNRSRRGTDPFVEVSWQQALQLRSREPGVRRGKRSVAGD